MTEPHQRSLAESFLTKPVRWYGALYAVGFLGSSAALDIRSYLQGTGVSLGWRYPFPMGFAIVPWYSLRSWAHDILAPPANAVGRDAERHAAAGPIIGRSRPSPRGAPAYREGSD